MLFANITQPLEWLASFCFFQKPRFVLTYLFGHLAVDQSSFWFDRLCIPQINLWVRAQTLQHVPVFVAHSSQMLVLWDDTYFERLWCNYELAVHVKAAASKDAPALQLVPMWMPIWTLSSCGLFTIAGFLFAEQGSTTESVDLDSVDSPVSLFMSIYNRHFNIPICLYLAVSVVFSWFCFGKVRRHKKMLDQMTNFDLRNARWADPYCWWETSCTSWDEKHPINNEIKYMSAGAGFRLSTLCFSSKHFPLKQVNQIAVILDHFFAYPLTKRDDHEPRGSSSQWTGKQCRNIFQLDKIHLVLVMTMCRPSTTHLSKLIDPQWFIGG